MAKNLSKSLYLLLFSIGLCCIAYPLAVWMIGQTLFPFQANGSLLVNAKGEPIGSLLIAQPFTEDHYFHPRPSAAAYDAAASSSSALAPSNHKLKERIKDATRKIIASNKEAHDLMQKIPADMVTTSASGLDPHITFENAEYQLSRIASAWGLKLQQDPAIIKEEIMEILKENASRPLMGLAGEAFVNVLELNIKLEQHFLPADDG